MHRSTLATALALTLTGSGCFSPNIFAIANAGPQITTVTPPSAPVDGQPSHWVVTWKGGEGPYSIEFTAFAEVASGSGDDSVSFHAADIRSPFAFDVSLPDRNPGQGPNVGWRVEIRDVHWTANSGGGNPFIPSYHPSDSETGVVVTVDAP